MGTNDVLRTSIQHTHDELAEQLEAARSMAAPAGRPREGYARIDSFLAAASMHMHAADAELVPPAQKALPDDSEVVHDYLHAVRELEIVLAHVKAHEYGSVYETSFEWPEVWSDVEEAMAEHRKREDQLVDSLTEALDDAELDELAQRLHDAEPAAPSRPHPYIPHTGLLGLVARKVMHVADRFWDTAEGRMVPEPEREPKPPPGKVAQYFLADPRFDEEEEEEQQTKPQP